MIHDLVMICASVESVETLRLTSKMLVVLQRWHPALAVYASFQLSSSSNETRSAPTLRSTLATFLTQSPNFVDSPSRRVLLARINRSLTFRTRLIKACLDRTQIVAQLIEMLPNVCDLGKSSSSLPRLPVGSSTFPCLLVFSRHVWESLSELQQRLKHCQCGRGLMTGIAMSAGIYHCLRLILRLPALFSSLDAIYQRHFFRSRARHQVEFVYVSPLVGRVLGR